MGSCYSRQAQVQHSILPTTCRPQSDRVRGVADQTSAMSGRVAGTRSHKDKHSGFGFRMPHVNRSNRQNDVKHGLANGEGTGKTRPEAEVPRGKKGKTTSTTAATAATAESRQSLTSVSSTGQGSLRRAYVPRANTGSWRMIDDSSSAYSARSGDKLTATRRSSRSENTTPGLSLDDLSNGNGTAGCTPVRAALARAAVSRAPIAVVESLETLSVASQDENHTPTKSAGSRHGSLDTGRPTGRPTGGPTDRCAKSVSGSLQSRLRAPFRKYGGLMANRDVAKRPTQQHGTKWTKAKAEPTSADDLKRGTAGISKAGMPPVRTKPTELPQPINGNHGKVKEGTDKVKESMDKVKEVTDKVKEDTDKVREVTDKVREVTDKVKEDRDKVKEGTDKVKAVTDDVTCDTLGVNKERVEYTEQQPASRPRISSLDALETTSIGSIHSDDLMLDINLDDYEELKSPPSAQSPVRHRTRSRSRSRSRDNLKRRSSSCERRSAGRAKETGIPVTHGDLGSEDPLKELATLVKEKRASITNTPRRPHQQHVASRPASFPSSAIPRTEGATNQAGRTSSVVLRPPRRGSAGADDPEAIVIDGSTYRQVEQDVTNIKTMILKLKRVLQEDEFHGQSWINGFKLGGSQPTSPLDDGNRHSFSAYLEQNDQVDTNINVNDLIKENVDLKAQIKSVQHQMEEKDRIIMLLQQQMTKYECGYTDAGGKAYTHTATQTDKVSGFYKAGSYRSALVRRTSSTSSQAASRYRTESREKNKNLSSRDEVFLDLDCDYDDDLDLLMEEVSLGSVCLSSVGDNFSQCDDRPMSVTSCQPSDNSFSRNSSLRSRQLPLFYGRDSISSRKQTEIVRPARRAQEEEHIRQMRDASETKDTKNLDPANNGLCLEHNTFRLPSQPPDGCTGHERRLSSQSSVSLQSSAVTESHLSEKQQSDIRNVTESSPKPNVAEVQSDTFTEKNNVKIPETADSSSETSSELSRHPSSASNSNNNHFKNKQDVTERNKPETSEQTTKHGSQVRRLKFPSGRITNWSKPWPSAKPNDLQQSITADQSKGVHRSGPISTSRTIGQPLAKDNDKAHQTTSAKAHRKLPTLTSIRQSQVISLQPVSSAKGQLRQQKASTETAK